MSFSNPFRKLKETATYVVGSVTEIDSSGNILARSSGRVVRCSALIPVIVGDQVRIQGAIIVSKIGVRGLVPEYLV